MNSNNNSGEASTNFNQGAYPFPNQREVQAGDRKTKLILLPIIVVLLGVIAFLSLSLINKDKSDLVADTLPTVTTTSVTTTSATTTAKADLPTGTATVTVTSGTIADKNFISDQLKYGFAYPSNWTLYETQAYPMEPMAVITQEEGYMRSADNKIEYLWIIGSDYSDGGEVGKTITVKGKPVPLQVTTVANNTVYRFTGDDTILSVDIPNIERISFVYTVSNTVNQDGALNTLVNILTSLRAQ